MKIKCTNTLCRPKGFMWTCRSCARTMCQQHCTAKIHKDGTAICQKCWKK